VTYGFYKIRRRRRKKKKQIGDLMKDAGQR
jgi:hypothetical protein